MHRDFRLYLDDILEAIGQIREYILSIGISLPIVWDVVQNKLGPIEAVGRKLLENNSHILKKQE
jgi:uncharacterized protein with HEPN domain